MMRALVTAAGILVALGFIAASAAVNWRYGMTLSRSPGDQIIYAGVSLLCDIGKALAPFFAWWSWREGSLVRAGAAIMMWLACTGYSLSSAAGFVELNAAVQKSLQVGAAQEHAGLDEVMVRKRAQLTELGRVLPSSVALGQRDFLHRDRRWAATRACREPRGRMDAAFCQQAAAAHDMAERAAAAERLEGEIAELAERQRRQQGEGKATAGDARVGFIARALRTNPPAVQMLLSVLFVIVLELGSGLGLFIAVRHDDRSRQAAGSRRARRPSGDAARFARHCLIRAEGATITIGDLYLAYRSWCAQAMLEPLDAALFRQTFESLANEVGLAVEGAGADRAVRHVALKIARSGCGAYHERISE